MKPLCEALDYSGGENWREAGISATGSRIVHTCDGRVLVDMADSFAARPRLGSLALEITGGPGLVEFRDIQLRRVVRGQ